MGNTKTILVAPLHWGLGHATRCIPIIKALLSQYFKVIIASDGIALGLLQKEFPKLEFIELPSYNITYPINGKLFKWEMLLKLPKIKKVISTEKEFISRLVSEGRIQGIISDNRLGIRSEKVPSVYITHQLNVLSGNTTSFTSKVHQKFIKKFDECWVPDVKGKESLSGELGHLINPSFSIKYLGILSRMKKIDLPIKFDILILLSGPEPQRTLLEEKLKQELIGKNKKVLLVQGCVEKFQKKKHLENITLYNFMESNELEKAINESGFIISRSGYTTIMDLAALNKKVFFIPTPGQYEQEYLAKRMEQLQMATFCKQREFSFDKLKDIKYYSGLRIVNKQNNFKDLFSLF